MLRREHGLTPANDGSVLVKPPTDVIGIVATSAMGDINCWHFVSLALLRGAVFSSTATTSR